LSVYFCKEKVEPFPSSIELIGLPGTIEVCFLSMKPFFSALNHFF
jgi:hypothetical protein